MSEKAFSSQYEEYLVRATTELGDVEVGQYAKFQGRLVRMLSYESFEELYQRYLEAQQMYDQILNNGDTVNDAIDGLLDDHATELLLKR